jgi:phosphomevalonate kinase
MRIRASAPGKLVVLGEFAVLKGAPAVVVAVDRRARVELCPAMGWTVDAPAQGVHGHALSLTSGTVRHLGDEAVAARLGVVSAALETAALMVSEAGRSLRPLWLTTDTHELSLASGEKLGLGASAALCTAVVAGVCASAGLRLEPETLMLASIAAHRRAQGGGSGIDVAASALGGTLLFRLDPLGAPHARSVELPAGLHLLAVWSGQSQSTPRVLAALEAFRERAPEAHATAYGHLTAASRRGAAALEAGSCADFLAAAAEFAAAVDALGRTSGVELVSDSHRQLGAIVTAAGGVYKPSGAGGDLGLALCPGAETGARVAAALAARGATTLEVEPGALPATFERQD